MNNVAASLPGATPVRDSDTLAAEVEARLRKHARHLMRVFSINDGDDLAGRLTGLPASTNEQSVCQWLMQYQHELAWRDFQGKEFRGAVQVLRNRLVSLPARTQAQG
ncbi:MAG TPA: hypothetical protein VFA75_21405 [Nevskia sp.]|nr:hypothetical protein [Nevskia sp.]